MLDVFYLPKKNLWFFGGSQLKKPPCITFRLFLMADLFQLGPLSLGHLYHIEIIPIIQNRDLRLSKRRPKDGSWLWPWPITRTLGKHSWTDLWIVKPCETEDISEIWVPQSWQSLSDLTIKSDTGQHSQFLQCLESFQTFGKHNDS